MPITSEIISNILASVRAAIQSGPGSLELLAKGTYHNSALTLDELDRPMQTMVDAMLEAPGLDALTPIEANTVVALVFVLMMERWKRPTETFTLPQIGDVNMKAMEVRAAALASAPGFQLPIIDAPPDQCAIVAAAAETAVRDPAVAHEAGPGSAGRRRRQRRGKGAAAAAEAAHAPVPAPAPAPAPVPVPVPARIPTPVRAPAPKVQGKGGRAANAQMVQRGRGGGGGRGR